MMVLVISSIIAEAAGRIHEFVAFFGDRTYYSKDRGAVGAYGTVFR